MHDLTETSPGSAHRDARRDAACATAIGVGSAGRVGLAPMDWFFVANGLLFVLMCVFAYYDRWVAYMGAGRITEFVVYAGVIVAALAALRAALPRLPVPAWLLVVVELGILAHFAGGFVHLDGARLYDHHLLGLRYDKYVHAGNAFIGGIGVLQVCRLRGLPTTVFVRTLAFFAVLGLGAVIEVSEFVVTRTVEHHGVGGYDDTIADLVSNVCGGLLFIAVGGRLASRLGGPASAASPATSSSEPRS